MNERLQYLRSLPRYDLLKEIRAAAEDPHIVLWEMVPYGAIWVACRAGVITAERLGIEKGLVFGYHADRMGNCDLRPTGSAFGDLCNCVRQETPPYPDPFA
jgi:hypothetical protein